MSTIKSTFARPPFIGLLAFVIVFIVQALGHTVMVAMENIFGEPTSTSPPSRSARSARSCSSSA